MVQRKLQNQCLERAKIYPIVTIVGPRQSGKTTLAKSTWPDKPYFNLELPNVRSRISEDPIRFLSENKGGAILDEIQNYPELLSYLQADVDENKINGRFILTGSSQPELSQGISQSLAGRTGILRLLPFDFEELSTIADTGNTDLLMYQGFLPRIHDQHIPPTEGYGDYTATYVEKDIRKIAAIKNLDQFHRFIGLCAGRIGQILDMSSLGNDVGVSGNTIREWLSIMEASFIIYRLKPWFDNIGKRLIKSPKIYFYDTGLAAYLCGIEKPEHLINHPMRGHLFENMVIMEALKARFNRGLTDNLYYYRDSNGLEIDLIIPHGNNLQPIEIKSSMTVMPGLYQNIKKIRDIYPSRLVSPLLLHAGTDEYEVSDINVCPWQYVSKKI